MRGRKNLAQRPPVEAFVESLSHDGRGIASIDGKKAFIFGALPGEQVTFKVTSSKKAYDEGEMVDLLNQPSPLRVTPPCTYFGQCGGCNLQHLETSAALKHKEQVVLENLSHMGQVVPEKILPAISSPTEHYRRKARLGVRYVIKKESLLVGFRERTSNRIAIMDSCQTLDARVGNLVTALKEMIRELDSFDSIAQIEVAMSAERVALVIRNMQALSAQDEEALVNFVKVHSAINLDIYLQPGGPETVHKLYPNDDNVFLEYQLDMENGEKPLTFQFHPLDFIQVNAVVNQKMIIQAVNLLDAQPGDTILDLFCGLGNFTLPISRQVKSVVGVEGAPNAIIRAQNNAKLNACDNTQFYVKDLTKVLDSNDAVWANMHYNKIILDPPRTGAKEIVDCIERWSADKIVYVSCNPATLARDAYVLVHQKGYKLKSAGIMDMFPHTAHVETMAVFEK